MSELHWHELKQIFLETLELAEDERAAFIEERCGENADLHARLEQLLRDHAAEPGFLEDPTTPRIDEFLESARGLLREAVPPPTTPSLPDHKIVHFIGSGSFGYTWLAQEKLTGRPCAVKVFAREDVASELELAGVRSFKERASGHPNLMKIPA